MQIRIPKTKLVNRKNEYLIYKKFSDVYIFFDKKGVFIKKWFEGKRINKKVNITVQNKVIEKVIFFHSNKIIGLKKFNSWNIVKDNAKYYLLIDKYKNDNLVLCHNDLRSKNIIFSNNQDIFLIDLEWSMINHPYFDFASLILYCNFNKKNLINYLNLNKQKLNDFIYITKVFNQNWEHKKY